MESAVKECLLFGRRQRLDPQCSLTPAGETLGLPRRLGARELDRLTRKLPDALGVLVRRVEAENASCPELARPFLGGEARLISTVQRLIVPDMLQRVTT